MDPDSNPDADADREFDPRVLGDLVARDRLDPGNRPVPPDRVPGGPPAELRPDAPALRAPALDREYDYRRFCTTAWKVGNFLTHLGVGGGRTVAVADDPTPEPVLALYGAGLLGASVAFVDLEEGAGGEGDDPPRALLAPVDRIGAGGGSTTKRVAYGGPPDDPAVAHFERDVWSENPTEPPDPVAADAALLRDGATLAHAGVLAAARGVVDRWALGPGGSVAVRAPLTAPGTVVAGLVAPVLAGAAVLLPDGRSEGTHAVAVGDAPEPAVIEPSDVSGL